jgi:hypothetical protein
MFKTHPSEVINNKLSELKPLKYNQFRWWRRWDNKRSPLPNSSPLLAKIKNGDLNFSHYFWQLQYCENEINQKLEQYKDPHKQLELTRIDRLRRRKLIDDFEKDENEKLQKIESLFTKEFGILKEIYYLELDKFEGTLEQFYNYCLNKFKKVNIKSNRGRPKKIKVIC